MRDGPTQRLATSGRHRRLCAAPQGHPSARQLECQGEALPTLGAYEVELKDGYVVAARDAAGGSWSSDAVLDLEFDAEGFLVFARYADGSVWSASDPRSEIGSVVSGLRIEPGRGQGPAAAGEGGLARVASDLLYRSGRTIVRVTRRSRSSAQAHIAGLVALRGLRDGPPYPRVVTHAMVLGAVVAPVSVGVASAQTSPVAQTRLTVSYSPDSSAPSASLADALRYAAVFDQATPARPRPSAQRHQRRRPAPLRPSRRWPQCRGRSEASGFPTGAIGSSRGVGARGGWRASALSRGQLMPLNSGPTPRRLGWLRARLRRWEQSCDPGKWVRVAYVEAVDGGGGFTVSEMNFVGFGVVGRRHFNSNPPSLVGFIY